MTTQENKGDAPVAWWQQPLTVSYTTNEAFGSTAAKALTKGVTSDQPRFVMANRENKTYLRVGNNNVVIGLGCASRFDNCVVIGENVESTSDNQIVIGNSITQVSRQLDRAELEEIKQALLSILNVAPRLHAEYCEECERDTQGLSGDPKWCCYCGAKLRGLPSRTPVSDERVIDLDKLGWEAILEAAADSKWMPAEYCRNDWIADVCEWLRDDPPNAPAAGDALRLALEALEAAQPIMKHYTEPNERHQRAIEAVRAAIAQQKGEA